MDLPSDSGLVWCVNKQRNLPLAGAKNPKQFALLLLDHMAEGMEISGAAAPAEVTTGPSAGTLAHLNYTY